MKQQEIKILLKNDNFRNNQNYVISEKMKILSLFNINKYGSYFFDKGYSFSPKKPEYYYKIIDLKDIDSISYMYVYFINLFFSLKKKIRKNIFMKKHINSKIIIIYKNK